MVNFAGYLGYVDGNYLMTSVTVVVSPLAGLQLQPAPALLPEGLHGVGRGQGGRRAAQHVPPARGK